MWGRSLELSLVSASEKDIQDDEDKNEGGKADSDAVVLSFRLYERHVLYTERSAFRFHFLTTDNTYLMDA
jgi:hypothetical protein